ncbi:diguanylate cyclase [Dasania sp. GY-MA-18]|uniref:Diguanylate cyclase n=1 Tax=Dasania phycosphaerae TaxID=2950436 RepID=A0A9J6RGM1_9GAMM|nr:MULTISPECIES: diguanylate cyclase [Dasania]MCR8921167.1 diguanylate cyclase [Dasania sp. GY-MA-18]MCZ0863595.1 diguanylate cyclase [Dasania phycosphaerae]MCZ0867323.1 diguanylate cyclase [Dasania phycosphaerae]
MPTVFEAKPLSSQLAKPKILFVDDSKLIRAAALKMFSENFDLQLAENGQEGWEMIQHDEQIQVVFTDLVMPELDGFELLNLVQTSSDERIRQLPVIVVTGADNSQDAKNKAYELGATDFLTKPFDAADINARAQAHLRYQEATQSLVETSIIDPLTDLLNYRGFEKQLAKDVSFSTRHNHELTVLNVEVDAFKNLFVRIGRSGAETIIKRIAAVLSQAVRKEDTVARTGLSSFYVSLPGADPDGSLLIAHRICMAVSNFKATLQGKALPITVSVGACIVAQGVHADPQLLINCASDAQKRAARRGLGQVHHIDLDQYRKKNRRSEAAGVSIDEAIGEILQGGEKDVMTQMDYLLDELEPLLKLLNDEQRQRIINL